MASDSRSPATLTAYGAPRIRVEGLDMTGVGWSLRVPCQVALTGRPGCYCRLDVGHGGPHAAEPDDSSPPPLT
jgi:hypothetical protein